MARAVFAQAGLRQTDYLVIRRSTWNVDRQGMLEDIEARLRYPLFVKPVNLGSSIGISKVHDTQSLDRAIDLAAGYDLKIMVEASVENARELECAVLGNDDPRPPSSARSFPALSSMTTLPNILMTAPS